MNTKLRVSILQWFKMTKKGDLFTTNDVYKYVRKTGCRVSFKTVKNNLAILKKEGLIDYSEKSMIEII